MLSALLHKGDLANIAIVLVLVIALVVAYKILPEDMDYIKPLEKEDDLDENEPKDQPWEHFF